MSQKITQAAPHPPALSPADQEALNDLFKRGTPENTIRAYESDLLYISTWKSLRLGAALTWPEDPDTALLFILDHSSDLADRATGDPARQVAQVMIQQGIRRGFACPAPSTLDRRIASWRAFHRMRNLPSPFEAPLVAQARAKARRAAARPAVRKSGNPITRDVLEAMLATCKQDYRGIRDAALLMFAWASGGRRRSEVAGLRSDDIDLSEADDGLVWIRLVETKTHTSGKVPRLLLKGRAAAAMVHWLKQSGVSDGPVFRPISKTDRVLKRPLTADGVGQIVKTRLRLAGYPDGFASAHGLRSGFLTQAALDGAPVQAAMRLSLHRSVAQTMAYYDDVDLAANPASDLLESPAGES